MNKNNQDHNVMCVIGDGAMTGGMAYEALNNLGYHRTQLTVILNDNSFSISESVGGLSKYLTKMNQQQKRKSEYQSVKDEFDSSFRDHIEYADRRVPELNIAIEKIEDQLRVINTNMDLYIEDLTALNQDPSSSDFVSDLRLEIKSLEKTAADLMRKRVDLFLQFRKYELSQEDPAIQSELNAILKEAELATKKASQNLN